MKHLWIASTWINALLKEFDAMNLNRIELTRDLPGFVEGDFTEGDRLDLLSARLLWHRAEKLSDDPLLGSKIGLSADYRSIGVLAPIIWHSNTIGLALQNIAKFQTLISENGAFRYDINHDQQLIRCTYEETPAALQSSYQQILSVTVGVINTISMLSSGQVNASSLTVPEGYPASRFSEFLDMDVKSEGNHVAFTVGLEGLQNPISGCDATLYNTCLEYANALLNEKQEGIDVIQKVRRYVANNGFVEAEINGCAEQFNSYPRNLQRQLTGFGTSFRKIKEEVMKEKAIQEINKGTEIKQLAAQLGYSELSGFYRSFKLWFGVTPKKALNEGVF
ncbi:MAG: helix-turn-helix domain-containing protein [Pseudomonadota bacterium]|jgi:AraC-like DNA-binding protein|nr:helix-turn-helix domain-containing protein [Pseudomonadota bacterium]|tara:strand:+ start:2191 stop:3195 length:1005 start_codon:yes stop_codon:yes gene_type:complete